MFSVQETFRARNTLPQDHACPSNSAHITTSTQLIWHQHTNVMSLQDFKPLAALQRGLDAAVATNLVGDDAVGQAQSTAAPAAWVQAVASSDWGVTAQLRQLLDTNDVNNVGVVVFFETRCAVSLCALSRFRG